MGGYAPPPQDEWRPATAAEADYNNRIGRDNRARVGLGDSYGRSQEYARRVQQEQLQQVQTQRQIDQQRQRDEYQQGNPRGDAYRMALDAERTGRVLDPYVERKAREQGYGGNVLVGDVAASRATVPTREYESLPSNLTASESGFGETITGYVPYGRGQTELERVKVKYTPYGEVGFYQKDPTRDTWRLVSSGSAAALQSGQFTRDQPQTPLVFTQAGGGTVLSPRANVGEALRIQANPQAFSRLGAESYGGFVLPLDNRTVQSTGARLSTYDNQNNLANLVDPFAVNVPKAQREPVTVPWGREISASTPAISPVTPPQERTVVPKTQVAASGGVEVIPFKAPFKSEVTHTYIPPSGETTLTIPFTEVTVFKGIIPGFTEVEKGYLQKPKVLTTARSGPDVETKSAIGTYFPNAKTIRISRTTEGLTTAPDVPLIGETYSGGSPEVDALETNLAKTRPDIESRKSRLESIAARNTESVNGELVWKGPEDEYYAFKSDTELLEKDVGTYNADVERFNKLAEKNPTFVTKYDMTKQTVTQTVTYEREGQSGYDVINAGISSKIQTKLPTGALNVMEKQEIVFGAMAERDPFLAPAAVGISEITYGIKNPLTAAASWGVGFGVGKIVRVGTTAMPVVKKVLPRAAPVIGGGAKFVGGLLVVGYGADVASRSTEGFTNFKPVSVAQKAIPIATYEILPMTSGFKWGYDTLGSARSLNDALPTIQQRRVGLPSGYEVGGVVKAEPFVAKWDATKTDIPMFDDIINKEGTPTWIKRQPTANLKYMTPDEYIAIQKDIMGRRPAAEGELLPTDLGKPIGEVRFNRGISKSKYNSLVEAMKKDENTFSSLVIERDAKGKLKDFREGRHRAVVAKELGYDKIPVWEFVDKSPVGSTKVPLMDNEAAVLMPNARRPVSAEPVTTKKPVDFREGTGFTGGYVGENIPPFQIKKPVDSRWISDKVAIIDKPISPADIEGTIHNKISRSVEIFKGQDREMEMWFNRKTGEPIAVAYGTKDSVPHSGPDQIKGSLFKMGVKPEDVINIHYHPKNSFSEYPSGADIQNAAVSGITQGITTDSGIKLYNLGKAKEFESWDAYDIADWYAESRGFKRGVKHLEQDKAWTELKNQRGIKTSEFSHANSLIRYTAEPKTIVGEDTGLWGRNIIIKKNVVGSTKVPLMDNEAAVFNFGGVQSKRGVNEMPRVISEARRVNLEPGMPETVYVFDAKTGRGIGMIVGEQGTVPTSKLKSALRTLPSGSEVALYHTHPSTTPIIELKSNWDMMRSGKITPKEFVKAIPSAVGRGMNAVEITSNPSLVDVVSAKSIENKFLTSGDWKIKIVEEGVIHRKGVTRYLENGKVPEEQFSRFLKEGRTPLDLGYAAEAYGRPIIASEPVTTKKPVGGYSVAQMREAWKLKGVPEDYGVPQAYRVPEPTNFLYAKSNVPVAGGMEPVGYPKVKNFEPSSSVQKMIESSGPTLSIYDVQPTYSVADNKFLADYARGKVSPTHIGVMPGTNIHKLMPEKASRPERIGRTGKYFMDKKSVSGGGGGGSVGGVIGNVGSRGGVVVDVGSGKLVAKTKSVSDQFNVNSGIFQSGTEYSLSAESGMTLHHLSPTKRYRMFEDLEPEVTYSGKLPPGMKPPQPSNINTIMVTPKVSDVSANRQNILTRPNLDIRERLSERSQQRNIQEKSDIQKRIREKSVFVSLNTKSGVKQKPEVRIDQRVMPMTKVTPVTKTRQKQTQVPELKSVLIPKPVARPKVEYKPPEPKIPPVKEPIIPFLPGGSGSGAGFGFQNPQYFRGFKERSPTWTVEEMSSSLFTGQLGPAKRKPAQSESKKQGRTKKVRNIRR